jgi:CMP-N,N'-diacetyllegionaminic acid synthase
MDFHTASPFLQKNDPGFYGRNFSTKANGPMTILCVIGARGGSQGLPEKNIKTIHGKPLIAWSIEQALATPEIDTVVVSTDSARIAEVAENAGAKVPFLRPDSLSGPTIGKFQVWQHALASCEEIFNEQYDAYIDLDCTNPLRDVNDISAAIAQFYAGSKRGVDAIFSVCDARKNPYFNLVEPDPGGALRMSKPMHDTVVARQSAPAVFEHVASIYVLSPAFIRSANHLLDGHAEGYDIGQEKSFDIDSEFDFQIIEWLLGRSLKHKST